MNIYDLAGNVYEWTLEYDASEVSPLVLCTIRGGTYGGSGSGNPASYRNGDGTVFNYDKIGFRASLYK